MTSLQIEYFLRVCENRSFSRAAKELFVSQPSVSRQIKLLESELGYALFDRTVKNRIELTPAGYAFRDCFARSAAAFESARSAAAAAEGTGRLKLNVGVGCMWDLSDALTHFRTEAYKRYPGAELSFINTEFITLRERLKAGALDVIVCTGTSQMEFDGLEMVRLGVAGSRAYVKKGLAETDGSGLNPDDFNGRNLLVLPEGENPMALQIILLQFQKYKVTPNVVRLPNRESILQSLLLGEGFTVFDEYMYFANDARLTYMDIDEKVPLCAVFGRDNTNPLVGLFCEAMQDALGGHSSADREGSLK